MPESQVDKIIIRMYRIGTGDCFVLKFLSGKTSTFHMMIDCGSCQGDSSVFSEYVREISKFVGGKLDLLVITHEHSDHIIGFARAKDEFDKITIDNVWVAWTEDPTNKLAQSLKKKYGKKKKALAIAVSRMDEERGNALSFLNDKAHKSVNSFLAGLTHQLDLYMPSHGARLGERGDGGEMAEAMEYIIKELPQKMGANIHYCYPGKTPPKLKGTEGIRFYILGPPENAEWLKKCEVKSDVYQRKLQLDDDVDFSEALLLESEKRPELEIFPSEYRLKGSEREKYEAKYLENPENRWRRIDLDWLTSAGSMAIRLEQQTNNTSLVLAVEFIESGKVLLFTGDAQSGNWESWHDTTLTWTAKKNTRSKTVTAKDLLERTVFYKVGHHLSHNGTASKSGLDLMMSEELVAFAALDYKHISSGWKNTMPAPGVMKELIKRTKGKVFRIDEGLVNDKAAQEERKKWSKMESVDFNKAHRIDDKFIEYIITT